MAREFKPWGGLMPSRSEQTKMVYYLVEIRDMRNILPPSPTPPHPPPRVLVSVPGFPVITITGSLAQSPSRELIDCQIS